MGHLLHVPDTDDVKQKNKNHETIPGSFFPEQKTTKYYATRMIRLTVYDLPGVKIFLPPCTFRQTLKSLSSFCL